MKNRSNLDVYAEPAGQSRHSLSHGRSEKRGSALSSNKLQHLYKGTPLDKAIFGLEQQVEQALCHYESLKKLLNDFRLLRGDQVTCLEPVMKSNARKREPKKSKSSHVAADDLEVRKKKKTAQVILKGRDESETSGISTDSDMVTPEKAKPKQEEEKQDSGAT